MSDDDFEIRPGRIRQRGSGAAKPKSLAAQVRALSNKAGRIGIGRRGGRGTGRHGRGRNAVLRLRRHRGQRRVLVKARVVRHQGSRYSAAPLSRHIAYLERDGVTRDGKDAEMFGSDDGPVDGNAFATRCVDDRHHFRFIVSPEDAGEMADLRAFTRELLTDMEADLGTPPPVETPPADAVPADPTVATEDVVVDGATTPTTPPTATGEATYQEDDLIGAAEGVFGKGAHSAHRTSGIQ